MDSPKFADIYGDGRYEIVTGATDGIVRVYLANSTSPILTSADFGSNVGGYLGDALIVTSPQRFASSLSSVNQTEVYVSVTADDLAGNQIVTPYAQFRFDSQNPSIDSYTIFSNNVNYLSPASISAHVSDDIGIADSILYYKL